MKKFISIVSWLLEVTKFAMLRFSMILVINSDMLLEFADDKRPKQ